MSVTLRVPIGTGNRQIVKVLKADGSAETELSTATRAVLTLPDGTAIDSATEGFGAGQVFDVATAGSSGHLVMHLSKAGLGIAAGATAGCTLTLYRDASTPLRVVEAIDLWGES